MSASKIASVWISPDREMLMIKLSDTSSTFRFEADFAYDRPELEHPIPDDWEQVYSDASEIEIDDGVTVRRVTVADVVNEDRGMP